MGSGLRADTDELRAAATRLASQATTFEGATASSIASRTDAYRRRALADAVDQFAQRWAIGLTSMATDLRDAGSALTLVADTLEAEDHASAAAARQLFQ